MQEVDRLIAESEVYLANSLDISNAMETSRAALNNSSRPVCTIDVSTDDEEGASTSSASPPRSHSPANEAIVATACAVANAASNLLNDSEIEILDCTTFPMPLPAQDDDEVFFVSERPPYNRNSHVVDLSSPSHININTNFGHAPTNINVNIDFGRAVPNRQSLPVRQIAQPPRRSRAMSFKRKPLLAIEKAKKPSPEPAEPSTSGNGFTCAVCLEELKGHLKPVSTNCGHLFCLNCLQSAIRISGKCPLCNKKQNKNSFHRIYI